MTKQATLFRSPPRRPRGRVTDSLEATIGALRDGGRLEPVDAAWIGLAREAAVQLQGAVADPDESRYTRGTLIARYAAVLEHLPIGHATDDTPGLSDLLLAAMGDTADTGTPD